MINICMMSIYLEFSSMLFSKVKIYIEIFAKEEKLITFWCKINLISKEDSSEF